MNQKEEMFKKLVSEQEEKIRSVCRYFVKDIAAQKDLFQEILINSWKGFDSFRGDAKPGTWMYRVAVNTALGFAGKEKKRLQFYMNLDQASLKTFSDEGTTGSEPDKEARLNEMENLVNQLSVMDKVLITLALEEVPYRDIAEIVGITEPNVRVKIHRIKSELYQKIKGDNYENNV